MLAAAAIVAAGAAFADDGVFKPWNGGPTPALVTRNLDGAKVDLKDLQGRVVVLNFWATWCGPCKAELPSLVRLKDKLAGKPFALVALNDGDSPDKIARYLRSAKLDLPVWLDTEDTISTGAWRVHGLPMTFVIDARGHVRYSVIGERDWSDGESLKVIESLMAEAGRA